MIFSSLPSFRQFLTKGNNHYPPAMDPIVKPDVDPVHVKREALDQSIPDDIPVEAPALTTTESTIEEESPAIHEPRSATPAETTEEEEKKVVKTEPPSDDFFDGADEEMGDVGGEPAAETPQSPAATAADDEYTKIAEEKIQNSAAIKLAQIQIVECDVVVAETQKKIKEMQELIKHGDMTKKHESFFAEVMSTLTDGPEDRDIVDKRLELLHKSNYRTKVMRLFILQSALEYQGGSKDHFLRLKESVCSRELKKLEDSIALLQHTIDSMNELKKSKKQDIENIVQSIKDAVEQQRLDDKRKRAEELERRRIAKYEAERKEREDAARLLRMKQEEEARRAREEAEAEAVRQREAEEAEEARQKQQASQDIVDSMNEVGWCSADPLDVDKLPPVEGVGEAKIKEEDDNEKLLDLFRKEDEAGKKRIKAERATHRADKARRRAAGETDVSDDEWIIELDGPPESDDDDLESEVEEVPDNSDDPEPVAETPPTSRTARGADAVYSFGDPLDRSRSIRPVVPAKRPAGSPAQSSSAPKMKQPAVKHGISFSEYSKRANTRPRAPAAADNGHAPSRYRPHQVPPPPPRPGHDTYIPQRQHASDPRKVSDPRRVTDPRRAK